MAVQHLQSGIQIQETYPFREISKKNFSDRATKGVRDILAEESMVEIAGLAGFGFPNFPESKKVFQVAYFKVNESYKSMQPLLNGLLAIGQPGKGSVEFYSELDTFAVKFYQSEEQDTVAFLERVFSVLKEEIRFKQLLKRVIEKQERFARESQLLKRELFAKA
jgi:hypothetical protein